MLETIAGTIYKHALKMRNAPELGWVLLYPVVGILSIGIFAIFLLLQGSTSLNPLFFVAAGALMWDFYGLMQRAIVYNVTFDVWDGCLRHQYISKSKFGSIFAGNFGFGLLTGTVAILIVIAVTYFAFNFNVFNAGIHLATSLFSIAIFGTAVGLIIVSLMLRVSFAYMALAWMITGVIMVFSGVYYPVDILPEPFKSFGNAIPATHSISALRGALGLQGVDVMSELGYAFLSSGILLAFAVWFYFDSLRVARKKGSLVIEF